MNCAVTGAFGYSGACIARRLLAAGSTVRTLTNTVPAVDPFGGAVPAFPLAFDRPEALRQALAGVDVLFNTYWTRFGTRQEGYAPAVGNTRILFEAAKQAGVRRIVHIGIAHPDSASPLPYYRAKSEVEALLRLTGLSHAVLRPTVLFGGRDILFNNMAWALRRLPVFGVFGGGRFRLRPVHVEDLAACAVRLAGETGDGVCDVAGPVSFVYRDLVGLLARAIGSRALLLPVPPLAGYAVTRALGLAMGDVVMTRDELRGLMGGLLDVDGPAAGSIRLDDWITAEAATLGTTYHASRGA